MDGCLLRFSAADSREGQKIIHQAAHPVGCFQNHADVMPTFVVENGIRVFLQELGESGNMPNRRAQIGAEIVRPAGVATGQIGRAVLLPPSPSPASGATLGRPVLQPMQHATTTARTRIRPVTCSNACLQSETARRVIAATIEPSDCWER